MRDNSPALITFLEPSEQLETDENRGYFVNESGHFYSDGDRLYWPHPRRFSGSMHPGNGTRIYIVAEGLQ